MATSRQMSISNSTERYAFLIENHKIAIATMEGINPKSHDQSNWILTKNSDRYDVIKFVEPDIAKKVHACGTSACALGWMAELGTIEGVQSNPRPSPYDPNKFINISVKVELDGDVKIVGWDYLGVTHFGLSTHNEVFLNTTNNHCETIQGLRARLAFLESEAAKPVEERVEQ